MKNTHLFIVALLVCIHFVSCNTVMNIQKKGLYDQSLSSDMNEIDGFKAIYIFKDDMDKSVWASPETQCVEMKSEIKNVFADQRALHVKWDKIKGGCKWIGIGFGWNNWMSKNMIDINESTAVQMQVKSVNGSFSNLPVAFAFEDYAGIQTYFGFQKKLASGTFNDSTWTSVTIPLTNFDFKKNDFNLENVKQFIIQLEGDGDMYLDNIKFIRL